MKFVKPSQLDQRNPGTWPIYYQIGAWIVMLGLLWFLYNRFFREEFLSTQSSNNSEITKLQNEYETLYQFHVDLPLYLERKAELTNKLVSLLKFLPTEIEMPNLIDETYKAAYENQINFTRFVPEASVKSEYYNVEPISLSTSTGFENFAQFTQSIGELPRILNVRRFDISVSNQNPELLNISSNLETYIYNKDISKLIGDGEVGKK